MSAGGDAKWQTELILDYIASSHLLGCQDDAYASSFQATMPADSNFAARGHGPSGLKRLPRARQDQKRYDQHGQTEPNLVHPYLRKK